MTISAVVFDMGGVLVELGPLTEILGDDPLPPGVFWARWLASPTVRAFEMGQTTADEFGAALVVELGLHMTGAELVDRFLAWPKGLFAGSTELVGEVRSAGLEAAVLSNTNGLHWAHQRDADRIPSLFTRHYLSHELGMAKPDREIFDHVVADLGRPPETVLFLDDNQPNVDAARAVGITAELARGPVEARRWLAAWSVLPG